MKRFLFIYTLFIYISGVAFAQRPTVKVSLDSTYVIVGMPTTIHLEATVPEATPIQFPDILKKGGVVAYDDSLSFLLELGDERPYIDTVSVDNGILTLKQDVCVFAFDSATLYIPPFEFVCDLDTLRTNSLALRVVVPFDSIEVDPAKFVDIKSVITPDFVWLDYIWWIVIPLIVIALLSLIYYYYIFFIRNKKKVAKEQIVEKLLPAHVIAMNALNELAEKKYWQNGQDKIYQTELTDILRQYIFNRFKVNAMEMTTDEILDNLYELAEQQKSSLQNLKQILQLADLVKFAKYKPFADENQLSIMNARMFVEQTKVDEEPIVKSE